MDRAIAAAPRNQKRRSDEEEQEHGLTVVGDGVEGGGDVVLDGDEAGLTGLDGLSLQVDLDTVGLGLQLGGGVLLDAAQKVITALGVLDVLNADVDTLLEETVADLLVDNDTNSGLGHVVDNTSATIEEKDEKQTRQSALALP